MPEIMAENGVPGRDPYLVKSVVHASEILSAFHSEGESLTLREIVSRCHLPKSMVFRLLYTLERCHIVEKVGNNLYRAAPRQVAKRICRIGYATSGADDSFTRDILASLQAAAAASEVELITVDNRSDARVAQRNARQLARQKVDLAIELQTDETVAQAVAGIYREAGIPLIAVDTPHPGCTYFGADNYEAGMIGGRCLARHIRDHWEGTLDQIVLLEHPRIGSLPQMRLMGTIAGLHLGLPSARSVPVIYLESDGTFSGSLEATRKYLRRNRSGRVAISGVNDLSVIGALRAFEEVGRAEACVAVGQGAAEEGRTELRQPRSRMIGSVGFFPEQYGARLMRAGLEILAGKPCPPAIFVEHKLVTPQNIAELYPGDVTDNSRRSA